MNHIGANEVKINKFRGRERAIEPKEMKAETKEKIVTSKPAKDVSEDETPNTESE